MNSELMLTYDTPAKCDEKYFGTDGRTDRRKNGRTDIGKTVYPLRWSGGIKASFYYDRVTMSMIEICMYNYQEGNIWIPLTSLTLQHFHSFPKPGPGIPTLYVVVFFGGSASDSKRWSLVVLILLELLTITV